VVLTWLLRQPPTAKRRNVRYRSIEHQQKNTSDRESEQNGSNSRTS